tara:strand:- start:2721 stop:3050 length:330 start_codon:yes stop_codon:yes gene_type:complete
MGLSPFSSCDDTCCGTSSSDPNPDPKQFEIVKYIGYGDYCLVKINYPNCTNYEGMKICLYNYPLDTILFTKSLDPHFSEYGIAPFARFEPTEAGWDIGLNVLEKIRKNS